LTGSPARVLTVSAIRRQLLEMTKSVSGGVIRDALEPLGTKQAFGRQRGDREGTADHYGRVASTVIAFRLTPVLYGSGLSRGTRRGSMLVADTPQKVPAGHWISRANPTS
jgi:hypothetical protein